MLESSFVASAGPDFISPDTSFCENPMVEMLNNNASPQLLINVNFSCQFFK